MTDFAGDLIVRFAPNQQLPEGWYVVQLERGHYIGTNGTLETAITVNRFHARKWAWDIARKSKVAA